MNRLLFPALAAGIFWVQPLPAQTNLFVAADGSAPFKSVPSGSDTNAQHRLADWQKFYSEFPAKIIRWLNEKLPTK
jgi:hypothetical protein